MIVITVKNLALAALLLLQGLIIAGVTGVLYTIMEALG